MLTLSCFRCGALARIASVVEFDAFEMAHQHPGAALFTRQQIRVAMWLDAPLSSKQIAARLHMDHEAFKSHAEVVYRKLGASTRIDAIKAWEKLGS